MIDPSVLVVALSPVLTAAVLGWFVREQRRNNKANHRGNPGDPSEDIKECVRAEAKDTRKAIHELHEKLGTEANRIIEAINRRGQ